MTLFLLLAAVWLIVSAVTAVLFSTIVLGARRVATTPERPVDVVLPQPRAHQDVRSSTMSGGRG